MLCSVLVYHGFTHTNIGDCDSITPYHQTFQYWVVLLFSRARLKPILNIFIRFLFVHFFLDYLVLI